MKVTNVSIKLSPQSGDRLKAFCTMTLDGEFVVRDLKIIDGTNGLFVAMPSRKLTDHCPKCGGKNHLRAKFCNDCGGRLPENRMSDEEVQGKMHADIAHPINSDCRTRLQSVILDAYRDEAVRAGRGESEATPGGVDAPEPPAPEPAAEAAPSEAPAEMEAAEAAPEPAYEALVPEAPAEPEAAEAAPEPAYEAPVPEAPAEPEAAEAAPEPAYEAPVPEAPAEPEAAEAPPPEPAAETPAEEAPDTEEKPEGRGHIFGEGIL